MNAINSIYALTLAVLITYIFYRIYKTKKKGVSFLLLFVLLFMVIFGTNVWFNPDVSQFKEIFFIPTTIAGLIMATLWAIIIPSPKTQHTIEDETSKNKPKSKELAVSLIFWLLVLLMIGYVITGMMYNA